jgi:hypothetical protein
MRSYARTFAAAAVAVMGLLLWSGCLSTHPGSSSMAYVDILTGDAGLIRAQAVRVFEADGYRLTDESAGRMVFEREATRRDQVLYGSYGRQLVMRVVVLTGLRSEGRHLVQADAFVVSGGHEDKLLHMSGRPYQKLLEQVKAGVAKAEK